MIQRYLWIFVVCLLFGAPHDATHAQDIALTQSYRDANVTFGYPAGWVVGEATSELIELGSTFRALDAATSGLDRGETYMRILPQVGALASISPAGYLEQLSTQATRTQIYGEINDLRINRRAAAIVTRDDTDRQIERIIGITDMGDGRIGGIIATVAQGETDLHMNTVITILASLSATDVVETGYWTFVDAGIRFRYPLDWIVNRVTPDVVNVSNKDGAFLALPNEALIQVVTFDLFTTDVSYEQVMLSIEAAEPTYEVGDITATLIGTEEGAVARYTVPDDGIEGLFVFFTLFDGRVGLVNTQVPIGELVNYVEVITTITESVEVPPTALLRGAQLADDTFARYETDDRQYVLSHPPNWLVLEADTNLLLSNDVDITNHTITNLSPQTLLMLVYPRTDDLPFPIDIRTPTAVINRFRLASASIGITQLSETVRTVDDAGLATSTVYGVHPDYDIWIIAQQKPNDQILTSLVYTPRGEMGLHQRQVRSVVDSFVYASSDE